MAMLNYDGRRFHSTAAETTAGDGTGVVGHYHQDGDVLWGEFSGGLVARGSLAGTCRADGVIHFAYCQVLTDSSVMAGLCTSIPTVLADGRMAGGTLGAVRAARRPGHLDLGGSASRLAGAH